MADLKELIILIAQEINKENQIHFDMIPVDENEIYQAIAGSIVTKYKEDIQSMNEVEKDVFYLSSILQLVIENFTLHYIRLAKEQEINVHDLLNKYRS